METFVNTKAVYKLYLDCGRQGELKSIFVEKKSHIEFLINQKITVNFGECLGKYSEIAGIIEKSDITFVSDDVILTDYFETLNLSTGENPFEIEEHDFDYSKYECFEKGKQYTIREICELLIL
jgi:hypothetical protein